MSTKGAAKKRPRTSGSSLTETVCASRRTWMCMTTASVRAKATMKNHQGRATAR
jgi:hypothetical protein